MEATDGDLGFALGQKYVEQNFPPDAKARVLTMVQEIEKMLGQDIQSLDWMTPATKQQALIKLRAVTNKIGYPDKWRDYSSVKIVRGDVVGNDERATEFEVHRELNKIGKPVDRSEWGMTPPTVNAYYNPLHNNINFPAGILQPPFFDNRMDAAVNYGAIGSVMGHELTHGFDDQGRQFDAEGNLRNWWTPEDAKEFEKRAECFIKEYSAFTPVDDVHLNGKLTLGENTADNGGVRLAFMALMKSLDGKATAQDRRIHAPAALLSRLGPGLVPEHTAGSSPDARSDRSSFRRPRSRERRGWKHAGVWRGLRLPRRAADGSRARLPRLVNGSVTRRSFLAAVSVPSFAQEILTLSPPKANARIPYGKAPQQFGDLFLPHGRGATASRNLHPRWILEKRLQPGSRRALMCRAGAGWRRGMEPGVSQAWRSRRRLGRHLRRHRSRRTAPGSTRPAVTTWT